MEKIAEINSLVRSKTRNELVLMCKEKFLPCTGTKHDMAVRIAGGLFEKKTPVSQDIQKIIIPRVNGRWVFNGIVFDEKTKNAVGRLLENGSVGPLQRKEIEVCKQYKFKYVLPDCLDDRPDPPETSRNDSSDEEDGFEEEDEFVEEENS